MHTFKKEESVNRWQPIATVAKNNMSASKKRGDDYIKHPPLAKTGGYIYIYIPPESTPILAHKNITCKF